jgi:hypothetical protein
MPCGCNSAPAAPTQKYEVKLPDGSRKIVNSEHDAKIAVTVAGGGTFSKV